MLTNPNKGKGFVNSLDPNRYISRYLKHDTYRDI